MQKHASSEIKWKKEMQQDTLPHLNGSSWAVAYYSTNFTFATSLTNMVIYYTHRLFICQLKPF